MRCQSYVNIPASEMFAAAGSGGRTFDSFLQKSGRAEAIWFPFTDKPWLKVWTPTPRCPFGARAVNGPFNYPFSDNIPKALSDLLAAINTGHPELTPLLGKLQYDLVVGGMALTLGYDLWGWSKDLLLYIKPSTLRVTANGYAVLTRRRDVQRVINEFYLQYQTMVAAYRANGHYPMNGPVEIRVSGLDQPGESIVPGAQVPSLSAIRPRPTNRSGTRRSGWTSSACRYPAGQCLLPRVRGLAVRPLQRRLRLAAGGVEQGLGLQPHRRLGRADGGRPVGGAVATPGPGRRQRLGRRGAPVERSRSASAVQLAAARPADAMKCRYARPY